MKVDSQATFIDLNLFPERAFYLEHQQSQNKIDFVRPSGLVLINELGKHPVQISC